MTGSHSSDPERYLKTQFLRSLAHAVRSPLAVAGGALQELRLTASGESEKLTAMAQRNLGRLEVLALRLDWVAELEEGQMRLELGPRDLAKLVQDTVARRDSGQRDRIAVDESLRNGLMVRADRTVLERAITLLLDNALRFSQGPVRLSVQKPGDNGAPSRCMLLIDDEGPGLDPEHVEVLFERFRSGRERGCTGDLALGLSLARDYLRLLGGDLSLESRPEGRGTRCQLLLDVAPGGSGGGS